MSRRSTVQVGGVVVALIVGFTAGQLGISTGDDSSGGRARPVAARLTEQVFAPPDGSELDGRRVEAAASAALTRKAGRSGSGCAAVADGPDLCVHVTEKPPPGVDVTRLPSVALLRSRRFGATAGARLAQGEETARADGSEVVTPEALPSPAPVPCVGDGSSGPRVQAIYAHAADRPNRYTEVLPLLRQYAADASFQLNHAAGRSGEGRVVRYVTSTSATGECVLDVKNVTMDTAGDDTFAGMVGDLRSRGYSHPDRKYLVFVDAAVGICGTAHVFDDDRPTLDNANTRGNMFARSDAPCWGYAEAHELLHTMGAVQDSAPNSTKAGHCFDETDAMCYSDTSGASMQDACTNQPAWYVDCGLNDYFNADPPSGSYLATHWNAADNPYLQPTAPPPPLPQMTITSASRAFAGNAWTVTATPDPGNEATAKFSWATSRPDCRFEKPGALTTRYWCPVTAAGGGRVRALLTDTNGAETMLSRAYELTVPDSPRRVALTLTRSAASIIRGQTATLRSRLTDAASGSGVIGMPVSLYRRPEGQSAWQKVATRNTDSYGRVSFGVQPARPTDYQVASGYTRTWRTGNSRTLRVTVQ